MKLWIARDKDGCLWIYELQPVLNSKKEYFIVIEENSLGAELPKEWFTEITFENSPQKVELKLV